MQGAIVIQLLLNLGICLLGILHGNTLLLGALQISYKFIVVRASFKLRAQAQLQDSFSRYSRAERHNIFGTGVTRFH